MVDESTSDTVCGGSNTYIGSVGWGSGRNAGNPGGCNKAVDSEYASFGVECGALPSTPDWGPWQQDTAYPYDTSTMTVLKPSDLTAGSDQPNIEWRSDIFGAAGTPTATTPPGLVSASSMTWNFQNSNTVDGGGWDMDRAPDSGIGSWQSPDVDDDMDVNEIINDQWRPAGGQGYLVNGSDNVYWEWPLVY